MDHLLQFLSVATISGCLVGIAVDAFHSTPADFDHFAVDGDTLTWVGGVR